LENLAYVEGMFRPYRLILEQGRWFSRLLGRLFVGRRRLWFLFCRLLGFVLTFRFFRLFHFLLCSGQFHSLIGDITGAVAGAD